jgi:hypothetical protein
VHAEFKTTKRRPSLTRVSQWRCVHSEGVLIGVAEVGRKRGGVKIGPDRIVRIPESRRGNVGGAPALASEAGVRFLHLALRKLVPIFCG